MTKAFKVYTKWTGYSEIIVDAKDKKKARELVDMGDYNPSDEIHTGNGLEYGYDDEEILEVEEIDDESI